MAELNAKRLHIAYEPIGKIDFDRAAKALYYLAFVIYSTFYIIDFTNLHLNELVNVSHFVAFGLLIPKIVVQRYRVRELFFSIVLLAISFKSWQETGDRNLLILSVFLIASQDVDVRRLAKILLVEELAILILMMVLSANGLIEVEYQWREGFGFRSSLGYSSPNRFGAALLAICCSLVIIHFPFNRATDYLVIILCAAVIYFVANSRTTAFVAILIAFLSTVCGKLRTPNSQRRLLLLFLIGYTLIVFVSIFMMMFYDASNPFMTWINEFFSGRPWLINQYYLLYPPTPFSFNWNTNIYSFYGYTTMIVDNAVDKLILGYGLVPATLYTGLYWALFYWSWKHNALTPCVFGAFIYAFVGLTEWQAMHFAYNYCLIGLSYLIFPNRFDLKPVIIGKGRRTVESN